MTGFDDTGNGRVKVLHVGKYFPPFMGGMESFLADLLKSLALGGGLHTAIVHDHRNGLRWRKLPRCLEAHESAGIGECGSASVRVYRVPSLGRMLYTPVSPQFPFRLTEAIRAEAPDVLHLHLPNPSAFWVMTLPEARRLHWVVQWHADVVPSDLDARLKLAYPPYRCFEQKLLRRTDAIVVSSPPYLAHSEPLAPWHGKCRMIPLGLDPSRIMSVTDDALREAEASWGDAGFRVLSVGRLTYYKGYEYLISAIKEVSNARALIVGEGERRRALERVISSTNAASRVVLAGSRSAERVNALMMSCDCLCLSSTERTEAFGLVLLEAMAHGKPTVVCDIAGSGAPWVVRDGETGLVVPTADSKALSHAFRALAANREMRARMGRNGRRRFKEMFRMDRVGAEMEKLYREVLEPGRKTDQPT